ncbi:hypothetical protein FHW36_104214 [Chitinophaga polysaccharea]|uniref:Uncharacterized protein n=1 Tax=Chitinophaga polysaccharea TaxID=1293035 RepID=A0A561PQY9_9BACT|nr:hypothetical protein [Chitinophaga polysaccharea]TWF40532.1 hypothetical protein FHW36_104214 [Chitinophaga polysaccharea]
MGTTSENSIAKSRNIAGTYRKAICIAITICIFYSNVWAQSFTKEVKMIQEKCKSLITKCKCEISKFSGDRNIYLKQIRGDYRTTKSAADMRCFSLDLWVYGKKLSLDSIYYANIENDDLLYIGDFFEGSYTLSGDQIQLKLTFINSALNTSAPSDHTFLIDFDRSKKKFIQTKLKFADE